MTTRMMPNHMVKALCQLPHQNVPSEVVVPGLLNGLESVNALARSTVNSPGPFRFPARQTA